MGYVIAAYTVIWSMIIGYGISLVVRFKRARAMALRYREDEASRGGGGSDA